jgi:hypothetical protein
MNLLESLQKGRENVESSDWLLGFVSMAVMLTFANFVMLTLAFGDQLTTDQFEAVATFAEVGVYLLAGFPAIAYLTGFVKAFELRSGTDESEEIDPPTEDVRFEKTADGYEEVEA